MNAPIPAESPRYKAFISYSHADRTWWGEQWGRYLHRRIEGLPLPGRDASGRAQYVRPVFRDRDELSAHGDLGEALEAALRASACLVVVCSRAAARSPHVEREVAYFKSLGRGRDVLCFIVDGEPGASAAVPPRPGDECFPRAVRFRVDPDGRVLDERAQPVAADARRARDGRASAVLKIVAAISGRPYEELRQREQARQLRRRTLAVGVMSVLVVTLTLLSYAALTQRDEARRQAEISTARMLAARAPIEQQRLRQDERAAKMALEAYVRDRGSGGQATAEVDQALRQVLGQPHFSHEVAPSGSVTLSRYQVSDDGSWIVSWSETGLSVASLQDGALTTAMTHPGSVTRAVIDGAGPAVLAVSDRGAELLVATAAGGFHRSAVNGWPDGLLPAVLDARRRQVLARDPEGCHFLLPLDAIPEKPSCLFRMPGDGEWYAGSADRKRIAATSADADRLWLLELLPSPKVRVLDLRLPDGPQSIAFSRDGNRIAIGGHKGGVWVLELQGSSAPRALGHTGGGSVNSVSFASSDQDIAAASQDGVLTIWHGARAGATALNLRGHAAALDTVVEAASRREIVSVDTSGRIRRWRMDHRPEPAILDLQAHQSLLYPPKVHALAFRPSSTEFVVAGDHGLFQLWDSQRLGGAPKVFTMGGPAVHVMAAGFSADGTSLAGATVYGEVKRWRLADAAAPSGEFRLVRGDIPWSIASAGTSGFAVADNKGGVTVWSGAKGSTVKKTVHRGLVRSVSAAPAARRIFTGSDDGGVSAIELSGDPPDGLGAVKMLRPTQDGVAVTGLAASPDGRWLAVAETRGVSLLQLDSDGKRPIELSGGAFPAWTVSISPDGKRLAAGGADGVIRMWSTEQPGQAPILLAGHAAQVRHVVFSPDGQHLVSGSFDSTVRVWAASTAALVRRACELLAMPGAAPLQATDAGERWTAACGR